jgi:hypothetical protein
VPLGASPPAKLVRTKHRVAAQPTRALPTAFPHRLPLLHAALLRAAADWRRAHYWSADKPHTDNSHPDWPLFANTVPCHPLDARPHTAPHPLAAAAVASAPTRPSPDRSSYHLAECAYKGDCLLSTSPSRPRFLQWCAATDVPCFLLFVAVVARPHHRLFSLASRSRSCLDHQSSSLSHRCCPSLTGASPQRRRGATKTRPR